MTQQGIDVLGTRWRRAELDGVDVMIIVRDNTVLTEPGFTERVAMAAQLAAEEIRSDPTFANLGPFSNNL